MRKELAKGRAADHLRDEPAAVAAAVRALLAWRAAGG
jgi:hypothetical protein